jgi:hypothetical protein
MSLRDIFGDSDRRPALGSGTDALVNQYEDENREDEQPQPQDPMLQTVPAEEIPGEQQSEKFLNRMIKIEGLPKKDPNNPKMGIFDDSDLLEQVILSSHDTKTMKKDIRRFLDNVAVRTGDGNIDMANERDKVLLMRLLMTRSLTDTEIQANERSLWTIRESRNKQTSTITNAQPHGAPGFLSRLFGR